MKPLFTLATTTVFTWATTALVFAAPAPPANANFTSAQGTPFSLVLDGNLMTNPVARQVHVTQLAPGRHWVEIRLTTAYGQPMQCRTTVWLEPGLESNYVLVVRPYGPQLQRVSAVALASPFYGQQGSYNGTYGGNYPPQAQTPTPNGGYNVPQNGGYTTPYPNSYPQQAQPAPNAGYPRQTQPDPNADYSQPTQPDPNTGYPQQAQPETAPDNITAAPEQPTLFPAPNQPDGSYAPNAAADSVGSSNGSALPALPADEVQTLTQELRAHASDKARLDLAKQALSQNSVTAEELAQLLGTLNLDKARIALAEFGYAHVSDPQNFPVVYEMFHLPASVREVQQNLGIPQN